MRPNTPREQLLQNLLAMSAVLLFRATKLLGGSEGEGLTIEIEEWFVDSQDAIKRELDQEYVVIPDRRSVKREETVWVPPTPAIREDDKPIPISPPNYFFG